MTLAERYLVATRWPPSRKTAIAAGLLIPLHVVLWAVFRDLRMRHDDAMTQAIEVLAGAALAVVTAFFAAGLIADRQGRLATWLPFAFAITYAVAVDWSIQLAWNVVALSWIPLASLLFAFHFNERVGAAFLTAALVVSIPLQAYFEVAPSGFAAVTETIDALAPRITALLVIANFLFCALVLGAQGVLERRLSDANRLIGRYVPAQLADRILAGSHDGTTKHERRKVTIFFSDVVGFTDLSDELDAEELATLLNEYIAEMTVIADGFGATVNQLVGDGIMIFFGAPTATDDHDHALRAVRMAQAMQRRMLELREQWFARGLQRPFHIRIGINTGFASVGDFGSPGRMMYSAIGQQTNLAARIQAHCPPDRILISHSTWALVQDAVACVPRGEISVKGLHYPVLVYEVADAVAQNAA